MIRVPAARAVAFYFTAQKEETSARTFLAQQQQVEHQAFKTLWRFSPRAFAKGQINKANIINYKDPHLSVPASALFVSTHRPR